MEAEYEVEMAKNPKHFTWRTCAYVGKSRFLQLSLEEIVKLGDFLACIWPSFVMHMTYYNCAFSIFSES